MKDLVRIFWAGCSMFLLLGVHPARGQTYNLMPQPAQLAPGSGRLAIDSSFRVASRDTRSRVWRLRRRALFGDSPNRPAFP